MDGGRRHQPRTNALVSGQWSTSWEHFCMITLHSSWRWVSQIIFKWPALQSWRLNVHSPSYQPFYIWRESCDAPCVRVNNKPKGHFGSGQNHSMHPQMFIQKYQQWFGWGPKRTQTSANALRWGKSVKKKLFNYNMLTQARKIVQNIKEKQTNWIQWSLVKVNHLNLCSEKQTNLNQN